jgi:uncharacterized protein
MMDAPADDFTIEQEGGERGALVLRRGETVAGRLDYRIDGGELLVDYVQVDPALRGQQLGVRLVAAAVSWARERGWRVVPICGYARRVLTTTPAFADVLAG